MLINVVADIFIYHSPLNGSNSMRKIRNIYKQKIYKPTVNEQENKKLSYHQQTARQMCTQYVDGILKMVPFSICRRRIVWPSIGLYLWPYL